MQKHAVDVVIVGAGGGGLRAAIEVARTAPDLKIALVSKVYPMRSHTVAAEGGAAGVVREDDSLDYHFNDTVSGGDWLCEQDVVQYFVENATNEMIQLEHWGCPWSRLADGHANVRRFGGMKIPRTWFAADKTGFHILHTLFQTSIQYPSIQRFDEHFVMDLVKADGKVQGVLCFDMANGEPRLITAPAVIIATGGAGRVYRFNTNGGIVTGDGMAMAYRNGIALRDMEFVQYHPTGLPGSGILMTEGCRGEGGILLNKDGYRYLQDYHLGPETPVGEPKNKYMELGPRDRLSQAFWHEQKKGRTIKTAQGDVTHLDLRHLGEKYLQERLPFICELAEQFVGVNPAKAPIPVRPTVHYTMGGIETDGKTATKMPGLYAVGECASVGLHGANRLGSNSLAEIVVFGAVAGREAAQFAKNNSAASPEVLEDIATKSFARFTQLLDNEGTENPAAIRDAMGDSMEEGVGIYRSGEGIEKTIAELKVLKARYQHVQVKDKSKTFNTDWLTTIELGYLLDVAEAMAHSALNRKESRGSHQRLDGFEARDDEQFLKHTLAFYSPEATADNRIASGAPTLAYSEVKITKSQPAKRVYGAESESK